MPYGFQSPYLPLEQACAWLRGNHHGHSTRSDGEDRPADIIAALRAGSFYASTGIAIHQLALSQDRSEIAIESDAAEIRWFVKDGRLAHVSKGGSARLPKLRPARRPSARLAPPLQLAQTSW